MDEKLPVSPGSHREDSFDTAVRGYNRQQVMDYMARTASLVTRLEQHLAAARADADRARDEAEHAHAEVERLRLEAAESKPVHEEVSGRLSQILRLAAEEADQERATADAEIAQLRAESQAESERLLAQAQDQAERELAEARETADRELADARARAERDLTSAREEAERLRVVSVRQADELIDEAQRRSGAVNEVSGQRLETLTATHGEAVLRLGQIRDVLADLLDRDAAAGSLAQVVEAVISPPAVVDQASDLDDVTELGASELGTPGLGVIASHGSSGLDVTGLQDATELQGAVDVTAVQGAVPPAAELDEDVDDPPADFYIGPGAVLDNDVDNVTGEDGGKDSGRHAAGGATEEPGAPTAGDQRMSPVDEAIDLRDDRRGIPSRR
jgi:cell division septum initiation protein DivIVA